MRDEKISTAQLIFTCPHREGICRWSQKAGWRKIFSTQPDALIEFQNAGQIFLLERGHGNPGQTSVVSIEGKVKIIRNNAIEGNLARFTGSDSQGNVEICSDVPEGARCDTLIPNTGNPGVAPWFPPGCLFPRFLNGGERACLVELPEPALLLVSGDRDVKKISLPASLSGIDDFLAISNSTFVILATNSFYYLSSDADLTLAAQDVLWVKQTGKTILFASYNESNGSSVGRYHLDKKSVEVLWTSKSFVPTDVVEGSRGLLLDVWGGGLRRLVFRPSNMKERESVVWEEGPSALWK